MGRIAGLANHYRSSEDQVAIQSRGSTSKKILDPVIRRSGNISWPGDQFGGIQGSSEIQGNVITLLLHLCDPDVYVVKACKSTIQKVGPYLDFPEVYRMMQECLGDDTDLMFTDFIKELIKRMGFMESMISRLFGGQIEDQLV
ncbi:uncharacterized protein LOC126742433 [Anthonomus grandis grandis]|uniref:uncharacterized protein LOC126742433 n=1 Tax=Anthonomus grandis grandis TaxID=2921223 RepID=UPI0021669C7C|nr:uncharacterized protein LOC126742433 [Anthonomus grandis grandis]